MAITTSSSINVNFFNFIPHINIKFLLNRGKNENMSINIEKKSIFNFLQLE